MYISYHLQIKVKIFAIFLFTFLSLGMNKRSKRIYILIIDGKAILFNNTLKGLYADITLKYTDFISYIALYRRWPKDSDELTLDFNGTPFLFQRLKSTS